jgi:AraC-like DNA-binding protein
VQGAIFAGLLFVRSFRNKTLSDFWLGVLLLVMCSSLITHFIGFANVYDNNQWLTYFPFEIVFALAPLIYLYVQALTNDQRGFRRKDLLLFLPALIYWIFYFTLFLQDMEFKGWYGGTAVNYYISSFNTAALLIWNAALLFLSIRYYRRYRNWLNENYSDTEMVKFNWLRNFLYIFAFVFLLESFFDIIGVFYSFSYIQAYYLKLFIALITYYLAVAGYMRSETIAVDFSPYQIEEEKIETKKDLLGEDKLERSKSRLIKLVETEKPYLDSQLTLKELSKKLGVNSSVLSHIINKGFGKNFNDFINEYRINEVKKSLQGEAAGDETFLNIAFESGFNSKATFNRAFKKFTGLTPKEYQENEGGAV